MALRGKPVVVEEATIPCKEATEALTYAIIALFCCGIILGPIALSKASKAKKMIALNPNLSGSGKVTAATIIAIIAIVVSVIGIVLKLAAAGQRAS